MKTLNKAPLLGQMASAALLRSHIHPGKQPDTTITKAQQQAV